MKKISATQCFLTSLYIVCLLISNIVAVKSIQLPFGFICTGGELVFPIVYILSDVFSEVYGYGWSRKTCWYAFGFNTFMVLIFLLTIHLPYPEDFFMQEAFESVLGNSPRILIGSACALVFGDWANDIVFQKLKERQGEKCFGVRAILSSLVGEIVDSCIVNPIMFAGIYSWSTILNMIITMTVLKVSYEAVIMPITYNVKNYVLQKETSTAETAMNP